MRIILDAFGGDNAPSAMIRGAAMAVAEYGHTVVLTGDEATIRRVAEQEQVSLDGIEIVHTADVIEIEDEPRSILKEHKNSSMGLGLQLVADGRGDAFVSAGSTGALIMGSSFLVKRIKGISRAALAPLMPSDKGVFMLLDAGANVDCRPEMLLQFARMGSCYMTRVIGGNKQPATVGLLNIGTEDCKGGELQQQAFALLRDSGLNFVGNVEARELPHGAAQVIVADGFSGNVALKMMEGTADVVMSNIKDVFMTNIFTKLAALIVKPHLRTFKKKMDTSEHGGAPVLGVQKPVIKAHGNSSANAVKSAIRIAAEFAAADVIGTIAAQTAADAEKAAAQA